MNYKNFFIIILILSFSIITSDTTYSLTKKDSKKTIPPKEKSQKYASLIDRLSNDGFDKAYLLKIFSDPRVTFQKKVLVINLINHNIKVDYSRFLGNQPVSHAKRFLNRELSFLDKVEKQFKVDKEVIVSILLIESFLGKMTGENIVFNVFSTLSLATEPGILNDTYHKLKENYPSLSFEQIRKRADRKSRWAYQELKHLLRIAEREKLDVFSIRGSWAGAFGIAQFLPSSYLRYGLDGNNDQKVRLFNRYDSMVSVANYLKEHGWKNNLSNKRKRAVIRRYNNSTPYANTVLNLSKKISS